MNTARRFSKIRIGLMRSPTFSRLGPLMMLGSTKLVDDMPTACTNGRDELYGIAFVESLKDTEVAYVIIHENMHKAGRHLTIYDKLRAIDPKLTNQACDYWNNSRIKLADPQEKYVAMPKDADGKNIGLFDAKYNTWTVFQIFKDLQANPPPEGGEGGPGEPGEGGGGLDEHDWDGAGELSKQEVEALEEDIKQAIRQGEIAAQKAGHGAGGADLGLGELLKPRVNWRQQLRQFLNTTCRKRQSSTWAKPNRRFLHMGIIMPSLSGKSMREAVIAEDVSGSMYFEDRFTKAMSEVQELVGNLGIEKVHLLYWDGCVEKHEIYNATTGKTAMEHTQPRGGGGTDPSCIPAYLKEKKIKPDCVVVVTDGEINNWGTWSVPVLWAVVNRHAITAPVGKTINIGED